MIPSGYYLTLILDILHFHQNFLGIIIKGLVVLFVDELANEILRYLGDVSFFEDKLPKGLKRLHISEGDASSLEFGSHDADFRRYLLGAQHTKLIKW